MDNLPPPPPPPQSAFPQPPPPLPPPAPGTPRSKDDLGMMALAIHVAPLLGYLFPFPGVFVVVSVIMWLTFRDKSPLLGETGREVLNFQITFSILHLVLVVGLVALILLGAFGGLATGVAASAHNPDSTMAAGAVTAGFGIAFLSAIALGILSLVAIAYHVICGVIGGLKATKEELWRYPLTLRLV